MNGAQAKLVTFKIIGRGYGFMLEIISIKVYLISEKL